MRSSHLVGVLAVVALFVCTPLANAAPITIDDFSFPSPLASFSAVFGGVNPNFATDTDASILGGKRYMIATVQSASAGDNTVITRGTLVAATPGVLDYNSSGTGKLELIYGLAAGGAALGDLTGGGTNDKINLDFLFLTDALAAVNSMSIDIVADTTTGLLSFSDLILEDPTPFTFTALFSAFGGPGSFASVNSLSIVFNDTSDLKDLDFRLSGRDGIRTQNGIPEPTSLLLCGMITALGGGWYARRKLKMSAA